MFGHNYSQLWASVKDNFLTKEAKWAKSDETKIDSKLTCDSSHWRNGHHQDIHCTRSIPG